MTVGEQFIDRVAASGDREAFRFPAATTWESVTWKETGDKVTRLAAGLVALGLEPQQRVGIASGTRYEWILRRPRHHVRRRARPPRSTPRRCPTTSAYILGGLRLPCRLRRGRRPDRQAARATQPSCPHSSKVVTFDGHGRRRLGDQPRRPREAGRGAARPRTGSVVQDRIDGTDGDSLATLIYTSGTTGRPKGVRLRHKSWTYEGAADPGPGHPHRGRPAVPLAADGALVRQGAADAPSSRSASPPRSTAGSRRSSTTSPWSSRPSWARRRGSSRRRTAASSRCRRRRAARRRRSSTRAFEVGSKVEARKAAGKSSPAAR